MTLIKKSITVTDHQEAWIQAQIAKGYYASDSEIIRELIRERQIREAESKQLQTLGAALAGGEKSGKSDKTPRQIKESVLKRKQNNGNLLAQQGS